jgi:U3 small nucleolar RNA-associated protein 23
MRLKRRKNYRKYLEFFQRCYGIHSPFKILCDGNFINAFSKRFNHTHDINELEKLFMSVLEDKVEIMTTEAVIKELRLLHASNPEIVSADALQLALTIYPLRVGSSLAESESFTAAISIKKLVSSGINRHKYLVATLDEQLCTEIRLLPGVPLFWLNKIVLILEEPSTVSQEFAKKLEIKSERRELAKLQSLPKRLKLLSTTSTNNTLAVPLPTDTEKDTTIKSIKRKKRAFAPNPLSVKKKKSMMVLTSLTQPITTTTTDSSNVELKEKSHRHRKRKKNKTFADDSENN